MKTAGELLVEQGRLEAQRKTLHRLLLKRLELTALPAEAETRVQAASEEQLEAWLDRVLDATTLEDVFGN